MILSFSSVFVCLMCSTACSLCIFGISICGKTSYIYHKYVLMCILLISIRCLFPFEFFYTITVGSKTILPMIQDIGEVYLPGLNISIKELCLLIWLGGAIIKFVYVAYHQYIGEHFISALPNSRHMPVLRNLLREKNIRKNIRLIEMPGNGIIPSVVGLRKPKIIISENTPEQDLHYILLHEIEHYQLHDLYFIALIQLLCIAYWWNPLFYLLRDLLKKMMEFRVDSLVVENFDEKQKIDYLESVLNCFKFKADEKSNTAWGLNICNRFLGLNERFENVLNDHQNKNILSKRNNNGKRNNGFLGAALGIFFLSTLFVIEPSFYPPEIEKETFSIPKEAYIIHEGDGNYNLYVGEEYWFTVVELDAVKEWPIYERGKSDEN